MACLLSSISRAYESSPVSILEKYIMTKVNMRATMTDRKIQRSILLSHHDSALFSRQKMKAHFRGSIKVVKDEQTRKGPQAAQVTCDSRAVAVARLMDQCKTLKGFSYLSCVQQKVSLYIDKQGRTVLVPI